MIKDSSVSNEQMLRSHRWQAHRLRPRIQIGGGEYASAIWAPSLVDTDRRLTG